MSEAISEAGDDAVVEDVAPDTAAEAVEAPAPEQAGEQPSFDPSAIYAELEHTRSQNQELLGILEQFAQESQQGQFAQNVQQQTGADVSALVDEYGNFNPQAFAQWQAQREEALTSRIEQMFQPLQQTFQQQQEAAVVAEGNQRLQDIIADNVSRNGEFASDPNADAQARDLVMTLANNNFPEFQSRFGNTARAAELCMENAIQTVRGFIGSVGGAAVTQTQNQLATLAEAHTEPGAHGAGIEAPVIRLGERSAAKFGVN